jgi:hypothetical protein
VQSVAQFQQKSTLLLLFPRTSAYFGNTRYADRESNEGLCGKDTRVNDALVRGRRVKDIDRFEPASKCGLRSSCRGGRRKQKIERRTAMRGNLESLAIMPLLMLLLDEFVNDNQSILYCFSNDGPWMMGTIAWTLTKYSLQSISHVSLDGGPFSKMSGDAGTGTDGTEFSAIWRIIGALS